jgi:adenosylcobinamide-phosphate synthase
VTALPSAAAVIAATTCAIVAGALADRVFGDPRRLPHLVRGLGRLISAVERRLRARPGLTPKRERRRGTILVAVVLAVSGLGALVLVTAAYAASLWLGLAVEAFLCFQCLAVKSLRDESSKVQADLLAGDLTAARADVSMIVGRDVARLDESEIARAAVETVAENTSDGVVAPLLAMLAAGGAGAVFYKAVNTMDSMLGYRDSRHLHFGRTAARLDDAANWLPARLSALLLTVAAALSGEDWRQAWRVWRRDRACHASPNAAQAEAACAGALRLRLGGAAAYGGTPCDKPILGSAGRSPEAGDIARANRLMSMAAWLALLGVVAVRAAIWQAVVHA